MKINRLPEEIVKRIAAGEVVERPASVVKELLENALDAQGKRIDLEIKGAGRLLIRITDDGTGMDQEDLILAVERHTTSKIGTLEDIDRITSLGFRGEALYSIAAISKMDITTRTAESAIGHRLRVHGGQVQEVTPLGAPVGTTIEVRDLFWNTPARLKFLKSSTTEINHIFETVALYSLTKPDVAFRLREGEKFLLDLARAQSLLARIQALYQGLGEDWIEVNSNTDSIRVKGYVGHPKMSRADRSYQFFFVNQRPVRSPTMSYALEAAFHSLVPEGRHPVLFIFIELDPASIDVNVHPAKREIRFHRAQWVQDELREAVRKALSGYYSGSIAVPSTSKEFWADRVKDSIQSYFESQSKMKSSYPQAMPKHYEHEKVGTRIQKSGDLDQTLNIELPPFKVLGCFDDLYWVIQLRDGLALIDQHAAHERVLYEKYLRDWRQKKVEAQVLLIPGNFELSKEDHNLTKEHQGILKDLGFGIEEFGPSSILVSQVPAYCETHQLKGLLLDILDDLKTLRKTTSVGETQLEERIILRACKSAVKAHDTMTFEEIQRLFEDLLASELPFTCPHGRPTLIKFTGTDLAKMFKRQ